jgi:hypothetical protein
MPKKQDKAAVKPVTVTKPATKPKASKSTAPAKASCLSLGRSL